jgi:type III restriction enzyme
MLEAKASNQMLDPIVLAKKEAALTWCHHATEYAKSHGGKPWRYVLIPHDGIAANMTLGGLSERYGS